MNVAARAGLPPPVERSPPFERAGPSPVERSPPVEKAGPSPVERSLPVERAVPPPVERSPPVEWTDPPPVERSSPVERADPPALSTGETFFTIELIFPPYNKVNFFMSKLTDNRIRFKVLNLTEKRRFKYSSNHQFTLTVTSQAE